MTASQQAFPQTLFRLNQALTLVATLRLFSKSTLVLASLELTLAATVLKINLSLGITGIDIGSNSSQNQP